MNDLEPNQDEVNKVLNMFSMDVQEKYRKGEIIAVMTVKAIASGMNPFEVTEIVMKVADSFKEKYERLVNEIRIQSILKET